MDLNKDGKVCEADLFGVLKIMAKEKFFLMLNDDICILLKELEEKRVKLGKEDSFKLGLNQLREKVR